MDVIGYLRPHPGPPKTLKKQKVSVAAPPKILYSRHLSRPSLDPLARLDSPRSSTQLWMPVTTDPPASRRKIRCVIWCGFALRPTAQRAGYPPGVFGIPLHPFPRFSSRPCDPLVTQLPLLQDVAGEARTGGKTTNNKKKKNT